MTNEERRQQERKEPPESTTKIQLLSGNSSGGADSIPTTVKVQNISNSGICIITPGSLELGQTVHFLDEKVKKAGVVVWTYQSKEEYKSGIKFE